MNKIRPLLWNVVSSGLPSSGGIEVLRKVVLLNLMALFGGACLFLFIFVAYAKEDILLAAVDTTALAFLITLFVYLRKTGNYRGTGALGTTVAGLLFTFQIAHGGISQLVLIWSLTYPLVALFLLGPKRGAQMALLLLALAIAIFALANEVSWLPVYQRDLVFRFVAIYIIIFLFSFTMEKVRDLVHNRLEASNLELRTEIADRKQAEEELKKSRDYLSKLYNSMADAVLTIKMPERTIESANTSVSSLFGYSPQECVGKNTEMIYPNQSVYQEVGKRLVTAIGEGEEVVHTQPTLRRKDGRLFPSEIATTFLKEQGQVSAAISIVRDITERKRAEEEKADLEARLRQTQRIEAIGTLAGGIAHDFNNILAVVLGNAEMGLMESPETGRARHSFDEITKACNRARDLVKQILAFSRQTEQARIPVRVSSIVEEVLKFLRASLPASIRVEQGIAVERDTVLADPTQIHQVLMNLCTNARHAMLEQGGLLAVTLKDVEVDSGIVAEHPDLQPGSYLTLTVSDTGYGMTPEVMARIFDPYFTTKDKGVGTGLGLAVVHSIVKSHGGAILVRSEPEKGSAFEVFLPLVDEKAVSEAQTYGDIPRGHERVLFVDDEKMITDLGKRMLQHLGYHVEVRTSSIEALEAFKAQPDKFDLVITDMTMPNMTGDRLAMELMGIRPDMPVILCTGYSERMTEGKAKEMGIRALVMKPMVMREMAVAIRQSLDKA